MATNTQHQHSYSYLEKQLSKLVRTTTVKCVANYLLYTAAALSVYLYADSLFSQVTYQLVTH